MSTAPEINTTPMHYAQSHFYTWIEFGDHLPIGETIEEQHSKTMKKLRHQLIHDTTNQEESII